MCLSGVETLTNLISESYDNEQSELQNLGNFICGDPKSFIISRLSLDSLKRPEQETDDGPDQDDDDDDQVEELIPEGKPADPGSIPSIPKMFSEEKVLIC